MTIDKQALLSSAKASAFTMKYISQFESSDIDADDVELRFEVDGVETGTSVSIVDECGHAAKVIEALLDELAAKDAQINELIASANEMSRIIRHEMDANRIAKQRIAELEARTVRVELPDVRYVQIGEQSVGVIHRERAIERIRDAAAVAGIQCEVA